jgi:hypothetical protein
MKKGTAVYFRTKGGMFWRTKSGTIQSISRKKGTVKVKVTSDGSNRVEEISMGRLNFYRNK